MNIKSDIGVAENARQMLQQLLGSFPKFHFNPVHRKRCDTSLHARVEEITLHAPSGEMVRAFLTGPDHEWSNLPAVLYCHAHGNRYAIGANELIEGRPALLPVPYGQAMAERGIIALSIDMPCFGLRTQHSENELSKRLLYQGQTLLGQMLAELGGALAYLSTVDGVDPKRIGVFGFSMGATHAFWLAALESNICACAHACAFADISTLVESGAHDLHGIYMTVPGLLQHFTTGDIAGLVAPRPQLIFAGALDPLTPVAALKIALRSVETIYRKAGAADQFSSLIDQNIGHLETPEMREAVLKFFKDSL